MKKDNFGINSDNSYDEVKEQNIPFHQNLLSCCPLNSLKKNYGKKALFSKSGDTAPIRASLELLSFIRLKLHTLDVIIKY
ncbi:hypothetical protein [Flavobacterium limi]|uniref:hypothetical protein n=1 Tax=Flavobacterium limi TaxID=2045105 RepID=UPI0013D43851|nr:hypothetical protein [Flavobacterium limi]